MVDDETKGQLMETRVDEVIAAHRAAGRSFEAAGVASFVRAEGDGEPVVLLHGLPSSSFLYRKVIAELASRGLRAMAFDLPGLGLAERPVDFDYTFRGLGRFAVAAADALGLDRFHLVVHDAGGPVGFELAAAAPDRVCSLTILNTVVAMDAVPFPMEIYARFAGDRRWSALPPSRLFRSLFYAVGVHDRSAVAPVEVDAYRQLVVRVDGGAAYLQIMRNVRGGARDYRTAVDSRSVPYPVQIIWGANDRILPLRRHGWRALSAAGLPAIHTVPGKHYLQEDHAPQLGHLIAAFIARASPVAS
jgi:haloalkane dehalogenase